MTNNSRQIALGVYEEQTPTGGLAIGIEAFWTYSAVREGRQHILPDGRMDVVAHFRQDSNGTLHDAVLHLAGPADRAHHIVSRPNQFSVGVRFKPGWGAMLLGVRADALRNTGLSDADARARLGLTAAKLLAIRHRDDALAALRHLAQVLLDRARPSDWQLGVLRSIDTVHRHCGQKVSPGTRSRRRQMLTLAGMPLSTLACLLRFQHAMRLIELRRLPLATIALETGYADQPHLNRDFRRFGAGTPGVPDASAPPTWRH